MNIHEAVVAANRSLSTLIVRYRLQAPQAGETEPQNIQNM